MIVPERILCYCIQRPEAFSSSMCMIYQPWVSERILWYCIQRNYHLVCVWFNNHGCLRGSYDQDRPDNLWVQGKRKLGTPPPIDQIMMLKLSPPRCIISNESVQQKWIDELWFRKQLSTCLFVWTLKYDDLIHLLIDVFL